MLRVDPRTGSGDLVKPLKKLGLPAEKFSMEYGDVAFVHGMGPDDRPVSVGVEVKTVGDLLQCIRDGRFAGHQLPGLVETYEVVWLLVEGGMQPGPDEVRPGVSQLLLQFFGRWAAPKHHDRMGYRDIHHYLQSLLMRAGVYVWSTRDRKETIHWLASLYTWWTDKRWDEHSSCAAVHDGVDNDLRQHGVALIRPTLKMMLAARLPGIGVRKAFGAAQHFPSIKEMFNADEREWAKVRWSDVKGKDKRLGKKVATGIVEAVKQETGW